MKASNTEALEAALVEMERLDAAQIAIEAGDDPLDVLEDLGLA